MSRQFKRISITIEARHTSYLRGCLSEIEHSQFSVAPVLAGYGVRGYWSSERRFSRIGERVVVSFLTDPEPIAALIASRFGILTGDLLSIRISDAAPDEVRHS